MVDALLSILVFAVPTALLGWLWYREWVWERDEGWRYRD